MPKRKDIKKILVVGAGPIIIGQACEFDYSGTQACKALKDEGFKVILVNSNPATIMTDPNIADKTYIEPITIEILEKILIKEKPDAILPTMGGQTALNLAMEAEKKGILKKYKIELIGANSKAISNAEDRKKFRKNMIEIGLDLPKSKIVNNFNQSTQAIKQIGLPAIIRPAFTLGGLGGGIARNKREFFKIIKNGLHESPVSQVLVEECLEGWKEFEMEVVRDKNDNCIIICSIENVDPMGIHTGDSVTIAPALTLTDKEYQVMRNASIACLRKIGVETGGSNVQFAINPKNGRMVIIEMNPRVSRSSALASKATGFPIAKVAAKLAVGYTLDELKNEITKVTPASFEPTIDYVVTKIPRFTFEKFSTSAAVLGTSMKSVGEAMAIGRNFKESLQKALVSLETGFSGLDQIFNLSKEKIEKKLKENIPNKILLVAEAFRKKTDLNKIFEPFYQSQDTNTKAGGTGIGLSYTRSLVKLLGGKITVKSKLGKGSKFTVSIPQVHKLAAKNNLDTFHYKSNVFEKIEFNDLIENIVNKDLDLNEINPDPLKQTILLVEDNLVLSKMVQKYLNVEYNVHIEKNGFEALKFLENNDTIDIIISDIMMPVMNGLEFCKRVKSNVATSHIPLILLTAKDSEKSIIKGLTCKADHYIIKPFNEESKLVFPSN